MATPPVEDTRPAYSARSRSRSRSPGPERFRGGAPPRGGYRAEGPRRAQVRPRLFFSFFRVITRSHLTVAIRLNYRPQILLTSSASLL